MAKWEDFLAQRGDFFGKKREISLTKQGDLANCGDISEKRQDFFDKAGEIFWQSMAGSFRKAGKIFGKAGRFFLQSKENFFGKGGTYFGKEGEISVPNLTFEREEEVKGINFGGQTFARP